MFVLKVALIAATAFASHVELEKRLPKAPLPDLKSNSSVVPKAVITTQTAKNVTISGLALPGYDAYLGIPFAEPPTGDRRFAAPVPKNYDNAASINATVPGPACLQTNNSLMSTWGISEDCLTLQVLTPSGTAGTNAKLPVMVWIYGGGFTSGAASTYISGPMIQYGVDTKRPFILVAMNYRLGIFGFGYGSDVAANKAGNLGIRDQILSLEWVRDHIAAFGGDPKKVTVFGESAGAISASILMLNQTQDLFRGAIMQSGAQSTAPITNTSTGWNGPYNLTAQNAGCMAPNTTNLGNGTTWDCMKRVPAATLMDASTKTKSNIQYALPFVWAPSVDGDIVPDSPWKMLQAGTFSRVPFITGNVRDEGTGFIPTWLTSAIPLTLVFGMLEPHPPSAQALTTILNAYPNVPTLGAPYGTGNQTFGLDPVFKQAASILGDVAFQSRRRYFLRQANKFNFTRTWSYEFWGESPGEPVYVGVSHGSDVPFTFGVATEDYNYTAPNEELGKGMMDYWINFAYYLDPNGDMSHDPKVHTTNTTVVYKKGAGKHPAKCNKECKGKGKKGKGQNCGGNTTSSLSRTIWLPHGFPENKNAIVLAPGNFSAIQDDYREDQMKALDGPQMAQDLNYRRDVL